MPRDWECGDGDAEANAGMGMGMMAGVPGWAEGVADRPSPSIKYEATIWGRYAKLLLSSSEFIFIN